MFLFDQGIWTTDNPYAPVGAQVRRARVHDGTPWAGLPVGQYLEVTSVQVAYAEGANVMICQLSNGAWEFPHNLWIKKE